MARPSKRTLANRINGKKGGGTGAGGRPKSVIPPAVLNALGPFPVNQPLKAARWFNNAIGLLAEGIMRGEPWSEIYDKVKSGAMAAAKTIPGDIIQQANELLNADAASTKSTHAAVEVEKTTTAPGIPVRR